MKISEIRIHLVHETRFSDKALAYVSVLLDDSFRVWDLRVIRGDRGPFVAMPSRKVMDRCEACEGRNPLDAQFCCWCGVRLAEERMDCFSCGGCGDGPDPEFACVKCRGKGTQKLYEDMFHPVSVVARRVLEGLVLVAYQDALIKRDKELAPVAETADNHECIGADCGFCVAGKGE